MSDIELYKKITRPPHPKFCPRFARLPTHLHSGKRHFWSFLGGPKPLNFSVRTRKLPRRSRFLTRRWKSSKKRISLYKLPEIDALFSEKVLSSFFRKSSKRLGERYFSRTKNASKNDENYAFWVAPSAIRRSRSGLQTGSPKSCKMTPKCNSNHRKMTTKKHGFLYCNDQKRTPSTDLWKCIKMLYFCRSRCCFAHAMDAKITPNPWKFTKK